MVRRCVGNGWNLCFFVELRRSHDTIWCNIFETDTPYHMFGASVSLAQPNLTASRSQSSPMGMVRRSSERAESHLSPKILNQSATGSGRRLLLGPIKSKKMSTKCCASPTMPPTYTWLDIDNLLMAHRHSHKLKHKHTQTHTSTHNTQKNTHTTSATIRPEVEHPSHRSGCRPSDILGSQDLRGWVVHGPSGPLGSASKV